METIVIIVHLLMALAIIGLVLMQQGKGAEMGASFGAGASQTVFGSQGSGSFFAKATGICAFIFFATSFMLAVIAKDKTEITIDTAIPAVVEQAIESDVPSVEAAEDNDIPAVPAVEAPVDDNAVPEVQ